MSIRTKILGTVCVAAAVAFAASPALADFNGTLQGDYSNLSADHGGGNANEWGGGGTGEFGLGWGGLKVQVDTGYHDLTSSGDHIGDWNLDGSLFWLCPNGRVGAVVGYNDFSGSGTSAHITNYGAFGEWYAGNAFTLGVKGGGLTASGFGGSANGSYFGGQVTGYVMKDLSLNASIDYASLDHGHITDYGVGAEWLVSESTPVSIFGGYSRYEVSGSDANIFYVGLRLYTNGNGATTLEDRQRSGTVGWASQSVQILPF